MTVDVDTWLAIQQICIVLVICALCIGAATAVIMDFRRSYYDGATSLLGAAVGTWVGYELVGWPWGAAIGLAAGAVWRAVVAGARKAVGHIVDRWRRGGQ